MLNKHSVHINERRLIVSLLYIAAGLVLLNILNIAVGKPSWQITRLIEVGFESNIPTWFSSLILAIGAFYACQCSLTAGTIENGKLMWMLLSIGLLGMSCDETAMIHESLGNTISKHLLDTQDIHSAWVIILGPFIFMAMIIFAMRLQKYLFGSLRATKFLGLGFVVFLLGAFVLEASINLLNHDTLEWLWIIESIVEESCEMLGVIFIIIGLMEHRTYLEKHA